MDIKNYEITMLDDDIVLESDDVFYATNLNGKMYGLQCNYHANTQEYTEVKSICDNIYKLFVELNKKLKNGSSNK